jgi:hypothetical protein
MHDACPRRRRCWGGYLRAAAMESAEARHARLGVVGSEFVAFQVVVVLKLCGNVACGIVHGIGRRRSRWRWSCASWTGRRSRSARLWRRRRHPRRGDRGGRDGRGAAGRSRAARDEDKTTLRDVLAVSSHLFLCTSSSHIQLRLLGRPRVACLVSFNFVCVQKKSDVDNQRGQGCRAGGRGAGGDRKGAQRGGTFFNYFLAFFKLKNKPV